MTTARRNPASVHLAGLNGVSIVLHPVGYQFPHPRFPDLDLDAMGWTDRNWLTIAGEVTTPDGTWTFADPCMLTSEAARLGEWLREAADGRVEPSRPDRNGEVYASCQFLEPNVAFGVESREAGDVILRVHFSLESAPPWSGEEQHVVSHQFFVRCWLSQGRLRGAADQWIGDARRFPERPDSEGPSPPAIDRC